LGLTFFALSSEYRVSQSTEFYYLKKYLNVSYSEFLIMPIFLRKFILNKWVEENEKSKG
jgi:hypothetical protein